MKWTLTEPDNEKKVQAVLLLDGVWHTVLNGSFRVDEEDQLATFRGHENFTVACPLSSIQALRVLYVNRGF